MRVFKFILFLLVGLLSTHLSVFAQSSNSLQETYDYQELDDGSIAVTLQMDGRDALFVLSVSKETALFSETLPKETTPALPHTLVLGQSLYAHERIFPYTTRPLAFRTSKVVGVLGLDMLRNVILTIDSKQHKLTFSSPYRPGFIKLSNRIRLLTEPEKEVKIPVSIDGKDYALPISLDFSSLLCLTPDDLQRVGKGDSCTIRIANTSIQTVSVRTNQPAHSYLGRDLLRHGLLSIDFTKSAVYFQSFDSSAPSYDASVEKQPIMTDGKVEEIGRTYFLNHIWDYTTHHQFAYKDSVPAVIDFWATWCVPCKRLSPLLSRLAEKYKGKIRFFKVNYVTEQQLSKDLGIEALPTLYIIPAKGLPQQMVGPKLEDVEPMIQKLLR